jgi:hypothetical protein
MMEQDKIYKDISNLPPEARRQVFDFISFLKSRYKRPQKKVMRNNIINDPFIGIWKDREDMKDSSRWLRNVRNSEWGKPS